MDNRANIVPALLLLLLAFSPAQAITPKAYDAALAQVQAALTLQAGTLKSGHVVPVTASPAALARRILAARSLELPNNAPRPIDNALLFQALDAAARVKDTKKRAESDQALAAQVAAIRAAVLAPSAPVRREANAVSLARTVLSRPEYAYDPLPPQTLWERFSAWLDKWIADHMSHPKTGPPPHINPNFIKGLVITLGVAAFAALVYVLMQFLGRRVARAQPLALDETEAALVEARDTDSLRALAEQQAQQGQYRAAFRLIYLATLVALDTAQVLRFDRSKTNWEYLRALRDEGHSEEYRQLTPLTRDFDRIWYGFAPADAADYARALSQFDALRAAPVATVAAH